MISTKEHMEKKIISNKKGMSLVEVVAALAIFSVLFIGVSSFIINSIKSENLNNNSIKTVTLMQGIRDILYDQDNAFFQSCLNKQIRIEAEDLDSIQNVINDLKNNNLENSKKVSIEDNTYISKDSSKNNPIKYIVYIDTKSKEDGLYNLTLSIITLNKSQYYYYKDGQKVPNGEDITLSTKDAYIMSQQMIIRAVNYSIE